MYQLRTDMKKRVKTAKTALTAEQIAEMQEYGTKYVCELHGLGVYVDEGTGFHYAVNRKGFILRDKNAHAIYGRTREELNHHLYAFYQHEIHGEKHEEKLPCVLCGGVVHDYGNNAEPLATGRCCDKCNNTVIAERLKRYVKAQKNQ